MTSEIADRSTVSAPPPTGRHSSAFRPDIEGLRGVAVFAVVAFHAGVSGFSGGYVGVDVFYVISGYLITGILQREVIEHGRPRLASFWTRRFRRLVPTLSVVVGLTLAASLFVYSALRWRELAGHAASSSLYVSNIVFAREATDYFASRSVNSPFLQTWSLGVEEQFYLAWPLLFLGLSLVAKRIRAHRTVLAVQCLVLGAIAVVSLALSVLLTSRGSPWAFYSSPTRAWEFAVAGLLALTIDRVRRLVAGRAGAVAGWVGLALVVGAVIRFDDFTPFPGWAALIPVIGTLLVIAGGAGRPAAGPLALLSIEPIAWLGRVSYPWYLWHWPLLVFGAVIVPDISVPAKVALSIVSLGLAAITHRLVENRFRFSPALVRSNRRTVAMAAGFTGAVLVLCVVVGFAGSRVVKADPTLERLMQARDDRPDLTADCETTAGGYCVLGDPAGRRTVMLLGDSHAAQWSPALDAAAEKAGIKVVLVSYGGCPSAEVNVALTGTHRPAKACVDFHKNTLTLLDQLHPDAVVIANADYSGALLTDQQTIVPESEAWSAWGVGLHRLVDDLNARKIPLGIILDTPGRSVDPIECIAKHGDDAACSVTASSFKSSIAPRNEVEKGAVGASTRGAWFDPTPYFCDDQLCPSETNGVVRFSDSDHITKSYSRSLSEPISGFLGQLLA
jgi:peptidoglycan/LPS O-acetylase OafA/YrhL